MVRKEAHAKVNLALDVLRKREDGYHEVRMIMQDLELHDDLEMETCQEKGIHLSTNREDLPADQGNLVYRACAMLMEEFGIQEGIRVRLTKRIPMAAGMAGGSADGAAALKAMNDLFSLGLTTEDLMKRGIKLGADVPYCVLGGTALAEGIGEILTPLPTMPSCYILVAKPDIAVATPWVYKNLKVQELPYHPDVDGMIRAIEEEDLEGITSRMSNVLEEVTIPVHPVIREIKEQIAASGAIALMSGSGPTVFGIYTNEGLANEGYQTLSRSHLAKDVFLTGPKVSV